MDLTAPDLNLVLWIQNIGEWLSAPMSVVSFLGNEEFFLLVLPVIYWCIDPRLGVNIGILLMLSTNLNNSLKFLAHSPRPFWLSPEIQPRAIETSFGIPSGHSQSAAAAWGFLPAYWRRKAVFMLSLTVILLIGLSRLVLAVHFGIDVLTGWLVGGLILMIYFCLREPVVRFLSSQQPSTILLLFFGFALILILVGAGLRTTVQSSWQIPQSWRENFSFHAPEEEFHPFSLDPIISSAAALFGLSAGAWLLFRQGKPQVNGTFLQKILRYLIGLIVLILLWRGLAVIFPQGDSLQAYGFRFLRYALVGLWVSLLAPLVFIKLRLSPAVARK